MADDELAVPSKRSSAPPATRRSTHRQRHPLTDDEREGILLAVRSAFRKLKNLYARIVPEFVEFGFRPPSAGVVARDLSEKIESSIVQHCSTFQRGEKHADLGRVGKPWEVKICKGSGLTINQSKIIAGENYIVVNYAENSIVTGIWVLWQAEDRFFSPRKANSNARTVDRAAAGANVEVILARPAKTKSKAPRTAS